MKRDATFFDDKEPQLIYIAKRLREALRIEELLAQAGVDFGVEADRYRGGLIFQTERIGAFFYVLPETAEAACRILIHHGYRPHEETDAP